jgi:ABC-type uncharacterized transport system permease subunit
MVSGLVAVFFYALGTVFQVLTLATSQSYRSRVIVFGFLALFAHLFNMAGIIVTDIGYNFGFFKIITLFCWTIVALVLLSSLKKPLENLFVLLFPLAILGLASSNLFQGPYTPHQQYPTGVAIHIILALLATSVITISAVQALFLAFENRQIKERHSLRFLNHLPPLQTMETLMFEIVWVGLILLTGVIVTGVVFMDDLVGQHLRHKLVLSVIAWGVFAVLLWGRHQQGWRGRKAIRLTLTGFAFLVLAYFGSKLVLELILDRV